MTDFPSDSDMNVTAFFKEKLPAGATVAWEWSNAGVGSLEALPADSNPADSRSVPVGIDRGLGDRHGARHRRRAGDGTKPSHFVITDPVSLTFDVKTRLEDRHLRGPAACSAAPTRGLRRQRYTAFLVHEDAQGRRSTGPC